MDTSYLDYDILMGIHRGMSDEELQEKYQVSNTDIDRIKNMYQEEMVAFQKIKQYIDEKKLREAYYLCQQFPKFAPIQSQLINILMKLECFEEALAICDRFKGYSPIQSQKVKILIKEKKWDMAIAVCNEFPDNPFLQSQKVKILVQMNKQEEALAICDKFPDEMIFQNLKHAILTNGLEDSVDTEKYKNIYSLKEILRNIELLDDSEISLVNTPKEIQCLLLIAYYEKKAYPEKAIITFIKKEASMMPEDTIKAILNHLKQKGKIFDYHFYLHLIKLCLIHIEQASLSKLKDELAKNLDRPNHSR